MLKAAMCFDIVSLVEGDYMVVVSALEIKINK